MLTMQIAHICYFNLAFCAQHILLKKLISELVDPEIGIELKNDTNESDKGGGFRVIFSTRSRFLDQLGQKKAIFR